MNGARFHNRMQEKLFMLQYPIANYTRNCQQADRRVLPRYSRDTDIHGLCLLISSLFIPLQPQKALPCSRKAGANANALILSSLVSRRFTPHLTPSRPRHFGILGLRSSPARACLLQKVVPRRERNRRRVCAKCAHPPPRSLTQCSSPQPRHRNCDILRRVLPSFVLRKIGGIRSVVAGRQTDREGTAASRSSLWR